MTDTENRKVFIFGLDCATPQLVFDAYLPELPNFRRLMEQGMYGEMKSTIPPITTPAWMCMMSGKSPGTLGIYGFRNRKDHMSDKLFFASSKSVKEPLVWDILGGAGRRTVMVGVPQTYPPKPVNGLLVSSFLAPGKDSNYTYPADLKREIDEVAPGYMLDVEGFRTDDKARLLRQIHEMTDERHRLVRHFLKNKPWDFFMMVEMGVDRIHHGFWRFCIPDHPEYVPGNEFDNAMLDYYKKLDANLGEYLDIVGDDTTVMVVSDHGAKTMFGGVCINEWLIREGYLKVAGKPDGVVRPDRCEFDWSGTRAWGEGGYYGRLFINVEGREPNGIVPQPEYDGLRNELIEKLTAITDEKGRNIGTRVFRPEDVYPEVRNVAPDLIVYFGDLAWRSVGSIGLDRVITYENDTGPDDANHAQHGIFIMRDARAGARGRVEGTDILDVAPTILKVMGLDVPGDMQGGPVF
ncbi:MAG TPA: alkaline phosphatase family protein [bacterium]|mgnify:CR=1 FL=1|nr:alkaline phosphatase family protein [bacterium]